MVFATSSHPPTISIFNPSQSCKKKPFLLLEILISILLVSLCLIPLVQSPIESYRAEMLLLEEMEGERLAEWSFSEIKEKLLNQEIPWEKLPSPKQQTNPIPLPSITIEIPGALPKKIERSFTLRCKEKGEKKGPKGNIYRMLYVEIHFEPRLSQGKNPNAYPYRLIVQKNEST